MQYKLFIVVVFTISWQLQEDTMNRRRHYIPAFGNWDYSGDLPITQYFESAVQAGLVRGHFHGEEEPSGGDLFKGSHSMKRRQGEEAPWTRKAKRGDQKQQQREKERKQEKVYDDAVAAQARPRRAPMAVDEDLYKIPPELLHEKPRRKRMLKSLWSDCLGLNCIA